MLTTGNDHKYVAAAPVQSSLCEVVKLAQMELQGLLTRQEEITRLIRNLRLVVGGLEAVPGQPVFDGATTRRFAGKSSSHERGRSSRAHSSLRRACRIALMEAEGTASPKEIYCRVVRRGSFSFANSDFSIPEIVQALIAMTYDGEVRCLEEGQGCRWCLVI